jgi:hypothetical protein
MGGNGGGLSTRTVKVRCASQALWTGSVDWDKGSMVGCNKRRNVSISVDDEMLFILSWNLLNVSVVAVMQV